jgi:quercetin dioxygenase-like cupin family protein
MSRFVLAADVQQEAFDWGNIGWRCTPAITGAKELVVLDVTLEPGFGHDFHKHPDQEEMIIVKSGRIEQWIEQRSRELGPGDSVYIDADVVHASFNTGDETAHLQVFLGPSVGEGGYELVDVAGEEPWRSLRSR